MIYAMQYTLPLANAFAISGSIFVITVITYVNQERHSNAMNYKYSVLYFLAASIACDARQLNKTLFTDVVCM